jgi:hypothetical protein
MPHLALDEIKPVIKPLAANPELAAEYKAWNESRTAFNSRLAASDPETVKEAWQRFYLHGSMNGGPAPATHKHKRRLANPVKEG